ncbi:hypothetical protein C8263_12100 [Deinococcus arcticus]|uniref:Uncharacterized protein n=1 Tax=Deinococcus arcticus TaxID=2136176 RepID=A0A2T3W6U7_9DEIO|nr:hypothetical protein C8263_12100 [Deinococcus arcticus]
MPECDRQQVQLFERPFLYDHQSQNVGIPLVGLVVAVRGVIGTAAFVQPEAAAVALQGRRSLHLQALSFHQKVESMSFGHDSDCEALGFQGLLKQTLA